MNERDLEARLRNTYRAEAERADPGALAERVRSIPATVEPVRRRRWHGFGFGGTRRAGPGGEQLTGGINMLVSMRTAAIVALLALGTSLVAVQIGSLGEPVTPGATEPGASWVTVTGTQEIIGTAGGTGGVISTMSDERVSGDVAITWSAAAETTADEDNDALWGTVTISNDGGTWQGQWVGFVDDQGRHHITEWFEGTGDYEGLRYIEQGVQRERGGLLDVTGLVYEGTVPLTVIPAEVTE
jgi:hypothetical protein